MKLSVMAFLEAVEHKITEEAALPSSQGVETASFLRVMDFNQERYHLRYRDESGITSILTLQLVARNGQKELGIQGQLVRDAGQNPRPPHLFFLRPEGFHEKVVHFARAMVPPEPGQPPESWESRHRSPPARKEAVHE